MNCKYCQSWNADDEHRCSLCGRRLKTVTVASQNYPASRSAPALALADAPPVVEVREPLAPPSNRRPVPQKLGFDAAPDSNIIPFESFAAHRIQPDVAVNAAQPAAQVRNAVRRPASAKPESRRRSAAQNKEDLQPELDFLVPAPHGPRTLETQVEAVIYCDATVATPKHRAVAAALDGGMIFTGFGLFLFTFHLMGGMFHLNRQTIPFFIGVFGTLAMFYGVLWIWSGRETLGMRWTNLRLIDFDGFPANRRDRVLRAFGICLSCCAGGIGLLWALLDEERLAWHDHMSKTFPTLQESNSAFFRKR
jgi:uncharacterized RDD family membrane protein YckC